MSRRSRTMPRRGYPEAVGLVQQPAGGRPGLLVEASHLQPGDAARFGSVTRAPRMRARHREGERSSRPGARPPEPRRCRAGRAAGGDILGDKRFTETPSIARMRSSAISPAEAAGVSGRTEEIEIGDYGVDGDADAVEAIAAARRSRPTAGGRNARSDRAAQAAVDHLIASAVGTTATKADARGRKRSRGRSAPPSGASGRAGAAKG